MARHARASDLLGFDVETTPPKYPPKEYATELPSPEQRREWAHLDQNTPPWFAAREHKSGASSQADKCGHNSYVSMPISFAAELGHLSPADADQDPYFANHGHACEAAGRARHIELLAWLHERVEMDTDDGGCVSGDVRDDLDFGTRVKRRQVVRSPYVPEIIETGLYVHETKPEYHASPDGIIWDEQELFGDRPGGSAEYKHPGYKLHMARLPGSFRPTIPPAYIFQVMAQMAVVGDQPYEYYDSKKHLAEAARNDVRPRWVDFCSRLVVHERCPRLDVKFPADSPEPPDAELVEIMLITRVYEHPEFIRQMYALSDRFIEAVRTKREPARWWQHAEFPGIEFSMRAVIEYRRFADGRTRIVVPSHEIVKLSFADLKSR